MTVCQPIFSQDLEHKSFQDSLLAALKQQFQSEIYHFPLTEATDKQINTTLGEEIKKDTNNEFIIPKDDKDKNK